MPLTVKTFALCALSLFASAAAKAATVTYNIDVNATTSSGPIALPVSASYTLTLDPTKTYSSDTTDGLTVNSLSFANGPSAFIYYPISKGLAIGGLLNTVGGGLIAGTDDYYFSINNFGTPFASFASFTLSRVSLPTSYYFTVGGTVSVTQVGVTPEPSSLTLLGTGVLGMIGVARRRFN